MSCSHFDSGSEWERRIALYAGGDLRPDEAEEVERVLAECRECAAVAETYRIQARILAAAHDEAIAAPHYAAVRARVLARVEAGQRRMWRWAWVGAMAAALVIAFLLFPGGVRAPERAGLQAPRFESPGKGAQAGVAREPRNSPAEAGDGTLKRAPRGRGGVVAKARIGAAPKERAETPAEIAAVDVDGSNRAEADAPLSDVRGSQDALAPNASRDPKGAVGEPAIDTPHLATSEPPSSPDHVPNVAQNQKDPLVIKLFTDDPDVVIYWIADGEGDSQ
jgi:hypothetical protein